jgi:hypothetical protein
MALRQDLPPAPAVDSPAVARGGKPVKVWAAIGAFFLALGAYTIVSWMLSPDFRQIPAGPTPLPEFMRISLIVITAVGPLLTIAALWSFVISPWRLAGRATTGGMFLIALGLTFWLDGLGNWVLPHYTFNSWLFNQGNWVGQVPGVVNPRGANLAEPLLVNVPVYFYWVGGVTLLAAGAMRRAKARNPLLTTFGLIWRTFAVFLVVDFLLEIIFLRTGYYVFPGTIRSLTLFPDDYYRFPIYESFLWGGAWTAFASALYFVNDRGESVAERGIDRVAASPRQRQALRFLAVNGIVSVIFMGFHLATLPFLLNADSWPADIQSRSYFTAGMCGDGTDYACWGPGVPLPRVGAPHLDPDGRLVPGTSEPAHRIPLAR